MKRCNFEKKIIQGFVASIIGYENEMVFRQNLCFFEQVKNVSPAAAAAGQHDANVQYSNTTSRWQLEKVCRRRSTQSFGNDWHPGHRVWKQWHFFFVNQKGSPFRSLKLNGEGKKWLRTKEREADADEHGVNSGRHFCACLWRGLYERVKCLYWKHQMQLRGLNFILQRHSLKKTGLKKKKRNWYIIARKVVYAGDVESSAGKKSCAVWSARHILFARLNGHNFLSPFSFLFVIFPWLENPYFWNKLSYLKISPGQLFSWIHYFYDIFSSSF